jgi:MFS family permease
MSSVKFLFNKIFIRDIDLSRSGFFFFVLGFIHILFNLENLVLYFLGIESQEGSFILSCLGVCVLLVTFGIGGLIIDFAKRRMKFIAFASLLIPFGYVFLLFPILICNIIGIILIIFLSGLILIDILTIFTHETTILNRGRLLSYILLVSFIPAHLLAFLTSFFLIIAVGVNSLFIIIAFWVQKNYSYVETEERLQSEKRFMEILASHSIIGYLFAFLTLGFVLGNAYTYNGDIYSEPFNLIVILMLSIVISGLLLDNRGRKWTFTASILVISIIIIFSDILRGFLSGIFIAVSVPFMFIVLFTLIGDFSTERNTLKYRGRITSIFILSSILGFLLGAFMNYMFVQLYLTNSDLWWIPDFVEGINALFLIIILVWIMPLREVLSSKEADWATSLLDFYVFNKNSVCLYAKRFSTEERDDELSEDLITGGLTGILSLVSEITNEKKHLRIIDKAEIKLYFSYGNHIIVALTARKYLPILFKKSEQFIKRFEKTYHDELSQFYGETSQFSEGIENLINRYFS